MNTQILQSLIQKGVHIPNPDSVFVQDTINPDRISGENVTLYAGCKLLGEKTLISKNSRIGYEAPVTLENTIIGENCQLQGGFFKGAVFAGDNTFGSGAHVREGTILEEQANAAHTVGLKQTILFPFVTLGSLINFCDCFMAGGTSRKNHSEVGSSFIHFNYTPNQDKATASMFGDVPNGVMLASNPVFLGGQGGVVGPVKMGFGCISAAGSIIRKDETRNDRLILGGGFKEMSIPRQPMVYKNIGQIYKKNMAYIAQLLALKSWYVHVRSLFTADFFSTCLFEGLKQTLDSCITERMHRVEQFALKAGQSKKILTQNKKRSGSELLEQHDAVINGVGSDLQYIEKQKFNTGLSEQGEVFIRRLETIKQHHNGGYIKTIQGLDLEIKELGTGWLGSIEQKIMNHLNI